MLVPIKYEFDYVEIVQYNCIAMLYDYMHILNHIHISNMLCVSGVPKGKHILH